MFSVKEKNLDEILKTLHVTGQEAANIKHEAELFPIRVPEYYLQLIDKDDPNDPIRKLCIPSGQFELDNGTLDTSGEKHNTVIQGVQHKYAQTALVLCSKECAMYCRHCFRRRLAGKDTEETTDNVQEVVKYITDHPSINNVLLSGGDALMLPTKKIQEWLQALTSIDTLDFIRIGSRIPVSLPDRIIEDTELIRVLYETATRKQLYVVTHFNHPNEMTDKAVKAVYMLQEAGIVVKNQTVLLKGINDDPKTLGTLLNMVTRYGMIQHYIFQCRPVKGVKAKFQVPLKKGRKIVDEALAMQNGLGKSADYTMSHVTGKITILGELNNEMVFKYRQAHDKKNMNRIFSLKLTNDQTWLPDEI